MYVCNVRIVRPYCITGKTRKQPPALRLSARLSRLALLQVSLLGHKLALDRYTDTVIYDSEY
jgi:hypothetical protein